MIFIFLKRLWQMLALVALQVLVCNHIHLMGYATPMPYVLFLAFFPMDTSRIGNMLWAFALGVTIDSFSNTPGEAAASLVLASFVQWPLLRTIAPKEAAENMVPTYKTLGRWSHVRYLFILLFVHHTAYYILESFSLFHVHDMLISYSAGMALTFVMMLIIDSLRHER